MTLQDAAEMRRLFVDSRVVGKLAFQRHGCLQKRRGNLAAAMSLLSDSTRKGPRSGANLVLSAEMPYRKLCKAFLVKSIPKNIPKAPKMAHKKLFEGERLLEKNEGSITYALKP